MNIGLPARLETVTRAQSCLTVSAHPIAPTTFGEIAFCSKLRAFRMYCRLFLPRHCSIILVHPESADMMRIALQGRAGTFRICATAFVVSWQDDLGSKLGKVQKNTQPPGFIQIHEGCCGNLRSIVICGRSEGRHELHFYRFGHAWRQQQLCRWNQRLRPGGRLVLVGGQYKK